MAGVTHVTVHPAHRRQGLLRQMMDRQLRLAEDNGQPIAGLWSSEEPIYGRFGFGPATWLYDFMAPAGSLEPAAELPGLDPSVSLQPIEAGEARTTLPAIYDAARPEIAGWVNRSPDWWDQRILGAGPVAKRQPGMRYVVC